jgi:hypothetical protein
MPPPLTRLSLPALPRASQVREAISILDLDVMVYPCPKVGLGPGPGGGASRSGAHREQAPQLQRARPSRLPLVRRATPFPWPYPNLPALADPPAGRRDLAAQGC